MRDVLTLDEVQLGDPRVIAGKDGIDRPIRWAHVVAGTGAAQLLDGGELVLTTGAGWPHTGTALVELARDLVDSAPAAIFLELGRNFDTAPEALITACAAAHIPLVALAGEVRFVQITQRVHQRILAAQTEALAARTEVHAMLTELGLNRSPVDYIIERLAETIDAPVVLADSTHRVVAWAGPRGTEPSALAPWARTDTREVPLPAGWDRVPVEAQTQRFGTLTALPGPPHPAGRRTVLELGAFALALGRLADREGDQWLELGSKQLIDLLLEGRFRRSEEAAIQLEAAGLPLDHRVLFGASLRGIGDFGTPGPLERAILETALRRAIAPAGRIILTSAVTDSGTVLLALFSLAEGDPLGEISRVGIPALAQRLNRELDMLVPATTPPTWQAHLSLGGTATRVRSLIDSLEQVQSAGVLEPDATIGRVTVQRAERQPLAHLVRGLAATPEMQAFAADTLGPLRTHDAEQGPGHTGDLVDVLTAYLLHPTNRSLAAQHARLSRSVFYQRLALIEEVLDVDLADGPTIATLTVALFAVR